MSENTSKKKKLFFDYRDLFTETKHKYFFNIFFHNFTFNKLELGKLFLKKYPVNFHFDDKILEIYDSYVYKPEEIGEEDVNLNKKNKTWLYIVIIVLLIIATGIVGYFLGKYLNKIRIKRANELMDEYDYTGEIEAPPPNSINS